MKKLLICLLSLLLLTACGAKGEKAELLFFYDGAMYCSDGGPSPIEIVPEAIIGTVGSVVGSDEERGSGPVRDQTRRAVRLS